MTTYSDIIFKCPRCSSLYIKSALSSYTEFDSYVWTDGYPRHEDLDDVFAKCEKCKELMLISQAIDDDEMKTYEDAQKKEFEMFVTTLTGEENDEALGIEDTRLSSYEELSDYCGILDVFGCIPDEKDNQWDEYLAYLEGQFLSLKPEYINQIASRCKKTLEHGIKPYKNSVSQFDLINFILKNTGITVDLEVSVRLWLWWVSNDKARSGVKLTSDANQDIYKSGDISDVDQYKKLANAACVSLHELRKLIDLECDAETKNLLILMFASKYELFNAFRLYILLSNNDGDDFLLIELLRLSGQFDKALVLLNMKLEKLSNPIEVDNPCNVNMITSDADKKEYLEVIQYLREIEEDRRDQSYKIANFMSELIKKGDANVRKITFGSE